MELEEKELLLNSLGKGDHIDLVMMDGKHFSGEILILSTEKIVLRTVEGRLISKYTDQIDTFEQICSATDDSQGESSAIEENASKEQEVIADSIEQPHEGVEPLIDKSVKQGKFPPDSSKISGWNIDKYSDGRILGGFIHDNESDKDLYFEMKDIIDENVTENILRNKAKKIKLNYFVVDNPARKGQRKAIFIHRLPIDDFITKLPVDDETDKMLFDYVKKKIEGLIAIKQSQDALKITDIIFDKFEESDLAPNFKNYLKEVRYNILKDSDDKERLATALSEYVEDCMLLTDITPQTKCNLLKQMATYLDENGAKKERILSYLYRAKKMNPNDIIVWQMIQRTTTKQDPVFHDARDLILSTSDIFDFTELLNQDISTFRDDSRQSGTKEALLKKAREKQFDSSEDSYKTYLKVLSIYYRKGLVEDNVEEYRKMQVEYAVQKAYDLLSYIVRVKEIRTYFDVGRSYMMAALSMGIHEEETQNRLFTEYIKALFIISKQEFESDYDWKQFVLTYGLGDDHNKKRLIWSFLIDVGSTNENIWNHMLEMDIADIYKLFQSGKIEDTYQLINEIENEDRNIKLPVRRFLHETFKARRERIHQIIDLISKLEMDTLNSKQTVTERLKVILKEKDPVIMESEKSVVLDEMLKVMNNLDGYGSQTITDHIEMLGTCIAKMNSIIDYLNNSENTTYLGKVVIYPVANNWKRRFEEAKEELRKEQLPKLSVVLNPEYLTRSGQFDRCFTLQITNKGERTASGYRINYTITDENQNIEPESKEIICQTPLKARGGDSNNHKVNLPVTMMQSPVVNLNIEVQAFCDGIATSVTSYRFTATENPNINNIINDDTRILWDYARPAIPELGRKMTESNLFFGRNEKVEQLVRHYLSDKRSNTYVLYGLSRTGKTSILNKLKREMLNHTIQKDGKELRLVPLPISLDIDLNKDDSAIWRSIIKEQICSEYKKQAQVDKEYPLFHYDKDRYSSYDLKDVVEEFNNIGIFPFVFIDEFSFISNMLQRGDIGKPFVHTLRQLALDEKACFIFAGTYDIKDLMNNPNSELQSTGAFTNINEMQIAEIGSDDAESLMDAMKDKLQFTKEAKERIHSLSGDIPYFIQIICFSCAEYAKNRYDWIGIPELNHVVNILIGNEEPVNDCKLIPLGRFDSNMLDKNHPLERDVLKYISIYKAMEEKVSPMPLAEIQTKWNKEIPSRTPEDLSTTIQRLLDKGIIQANGNKGYTIKVDIFRLWYKVYCLKTNMID